MSRCIGDIAAHETCGLSAEPDIKVIDLADHRLRCSKISLLLCSDGLWEFISSKQAVDILQASDDNAMEALVQRSFVEWMRNSNSQYSDDITGIYAVLLGPC